ncbi:uncharacterized protein RJT20DRAFT_5239 [Scheffersomyces xylosifermentans]|uniref:uncharacterized protein n=1 Tax=Scheffersomyces xylosifermentans TaxID=1304137 RepID=UPI00315CBFE1
MPDTSVPTPPISPTDDKLTPQDASIDASQASPSLSSISSMNSDSSTHKLIDSLSEPKTQEKEIATSDTITEKSNENTDTETEAAAKVNTAAPTSSPSLPLPKSNAIKPVRFTVRKISRDEPSATVATPKSPITQDPRSHNSSSNYTTKTKIVKAVPVEEDQGARDIAKLNKAQRKFDQYENRVVKIQKEIDFLSNLLPPYNVEVDYATRTKITKAIEKLKTKQDEIEKKKYGLGITISRLWRGHEDTDIWVRTFSN